MLHALALVVATAIPQDSIRLEADQALRRAVSEARSVRAAGSRRDAAGARVAGAGAWRNPVLSVTAENLGAQRDVTGRSGIAGVEGQATLTAFVPIGGLRAATIEQARAELRAADAGVAVEEAAVLEEAVLALAAAERDASWARHAGEEAADLRRFAASLRDRAAAGRSAGGEAARAGLEATTAATQAARRAALAAESRSAVARLLEVDPSIRVVIDAPRCTAETAATADTAPELAAASARVAAAAAAARAAGARAIPAFEPTVGLRRTAGFSGLLVGFSIPLPVVTLNRAAVRAARFERAAAESDREALEQRLAADRRGLDAAAAALDSAGGQFTAEWSRQLERVLNAALARFESGEGTLAELLDARRARLAALDDLAAWRAERRILRARLARASGRRIDGATLCDDLQVSDQ
jgi:cobalt-zinc-cadmium efflux system outer membrane protein